MESRFEQRLNQIISAEGDINDALDELEEERPALPTKVEYDEVKTSVAVVEGQECDKIDDYLFSRKILYGLINRGTVALEGAMLVARESEHPRAYEVSAGIMKNISEMTKDLLKIHEAMNPTVPKTQQASIAKQVNIQNNFNGVDANSMKDINGLLDDIENE